MVPAASSRSMPEGPLLISEPMKQIPAVHRSGKESMGVWQMSSRGWCLPRISESPPGAPQRPKALEPTPPGGKVTSLSFSGSLCRSIKLPSANVLLGPVLDHAT